MAHTGWRSRSRCCRWHSWCRSRSGGRACRRPAVFISDRGYKIPVNRHSFRRRRQTRRRPRTPRSVSRPRDVQCSPTSGRPRGIRPPSASSSGARRAGPWRHRGRPDPAMARRRRLVRREDHRARALRPTAPSHCVGRRRNIECSCGEDALEALTSEELAKLDPNRAKELLRDRAARHHKPRCRIRPRLPNKVKPAPAAVAKKPLAALPPGDPLSRATVDPQPL
jgi:hypothetical protein